MLLVLIVPSYTCIFHNCMSKPIFFLTLKVNDARGVLCSGWSPIDAKLVVVEWDGVGEGRGFIYLFIYLFFHSYITSVLLFFFECFICFGFIILAPN